MTSHIDRSVTVIDIKGKLVLGEGTAALRDKINDLLARGSKQILLNLAHVTHMDSSAIGELVAAHGRVTAAGGAMKLVHLSKRIHDLLQITKLHMVFEIFEDESSAISSFTPAVQTDLQTRYQTMFERFRGRHHGSDATREDLPGH